MSSKWDYLDELYEDFEQVERINRKTELVDAVEHTRNKRVNFKQARNQRRIHKERQRD